MLQIFEWFFQWWLVQLKQNQQLNEFTATIDKVESHYQSKSDALEMRQAAMTTKYEQQLAEIEQVHQQQMAQVLSEREVIMKSLKANKNSSLKLSQK